VVPVAPYAVAALVIGAVGSLVTHSAVPVLTAPVCALFLRSRAQRGRERGAAAAQRAAVLELCAAWRGELQAGRQPAAAFTEAVWCRVELRDVAQAVALPRDGRSAQSVLAAAAEVPGREALSALAACWSAAERHGLAMTEAVAGIEEGLRAEQGRNLALAAELSSVRATTTLLSVLPVFGIVLGSALGADPVRTLLHEPVGEGCLAVGFVLEIAGLRWTDRIIDAVDQNASGPSRDSGRVRRPGWFRPSGPRSLSAAGRGGGAA
jgi:tight adherence protein B